MKVKVAQSCPTLCDPMDYTWNRPAGVLLSGIIVYSEPGEMFGFFGSGLQPFDQAPFNSSEDLLNE